jgi:hypothetical protein
LSNTMRDVVLAQRRFPDTPVPRKHAEYAAFVEHYPTLGREWIRVAWFGRQVSPELQNACFALTDPTQECTIVPPAVLGRLRRSPVLVLSPPPESKLIHSFLTLASGIVSLPQESLESIVDPLDMV